MHPNDRQSLFLLGNGKVSDYKCAKGTMTQEKFEEWLQALLPALHDMGVVYGNFIFDNAQIHCRDISGWLTSKSNARHAELVDWVGVLSLRTPTSIPDP
jgi:hypothetical protein